MIYTVTFNPSLDYNMYLPTLRVGEVNRSEREVCFCGGKGINVSLVLREMGVESTALGFIAGFTGEELERRLKQAGVGTELIRVPNGLTRINVKLRGAGETDINGAGPEIDVKCLDELTERLDKLLRPGDALVLSGSVPASLPNDTYMRILRRLRGKDITTVVDASGELLSSTLEYSPFLIKPNSDELGELFGAAADTPEKCAEYARRLQQTGARNILVSMGAAGSVLLTETGELLRAPGLQGKTVNTVGAGDSMVAGFLCGYLSSSEPSYALRLGTAAGAATAFSEGLGSREQIEQLLDSVRVF